MVKDTFRKVYKKLKEDNSCLILEIKTKAEQIQELFANVKNREMSIAMTNLEQAVMWAVKAVILHDEVSNIEKEC